MRPNQPSVEASKHLPAGVKVAGHWEDQIVIQFDKGTGNERNWLNLHITELIKTTDRLACEMAKHGHIAFTRGAKLRNAAEQLLHQSLESKTLCIPSSASGSMTITLDGKEFRAYAWHNSLYFFGEHPSYKIRAQKKPSGLDFEKLKGWKKYVGDLCENNPNLIVSICHALSAPLRVEYRRAFLILSLVSLTTTGKTTIQRVVTSMWQSCSGENAVPQLQGTAIGVIDRLSQSPGQAVCFQDSRQFASADEFQSLLFSVADASSRFKYGQTTKPLQCTLILSNERSLLDMAARDKANLDEGVFGRYLEIHAESAHGMFHDIHEADNAAEFARELETRAEEYSGAVWPVWIASLAHNWHKSIRNNNHNFKHEQDELFFGLDELGLEESELEAVDQRLIREAAFSLWAGVLASEMGVIPFSKNEIRTAFQQVLKAYLGHRKSGRTPVAERVIEAVRGYVDQNPMRFPKLEDYGSNEVKNGCSGYRHKTRDGQELILFFPELFRKEFVGTFGSAVFNYLAKADLLVTSNNRGYQYQVRPPRCDKRKSFVAIKADICFDAD